MSAFAGSCCEEVEAREAEYRAIIRKATKQNEERMMGGYLLRQNLQRKLRCMDPRCTHDACGECFDGEAAEEAAEAVVSDAESDLDDDFDDDAVLAQMRARRMDQMRSDADEASRRLAARGSHTRLREGMTVASLLSDPADGSPIVLHLAAGDDDTDACLWVEDALRRAASDFPSARLVTEVCPASAPPECLPFIEQVPVLLVVEGGLISGVCDLGAVREPEAVRRTVERFLRGERERLAAAAARKADSDDEDEGEESYCGRPGCRRYPHEHVGWGGGARAPAEDPRFGG
jgi:hypothetical protein